jgi:phosphohistidine phosphatase
MTSKRTLFIVRHAKSDWNIEELSDIDRSLKHRGIRAAYEMARRIKIDRQLPDIIISSPANRALHTAVIFTRVFEFKFSKLKVDSRLYQTGVGAIKKLIAEQADSVGRLMIFGHNPDFSDLATMLSGNSYIELPTCGVCKLVFQADKWSDISKNCLISNSIDFPKNEIEA